MILAICVVEDVFRVSGHPAFGILSYLGVSSNFT